MTGVSQHVPARPPDQGSARALFRRGRAEVPGGFPGASGCDSVCAPTLLGDAPCRGTSGFQSCCVCPAPSCGNPIAGSPSPSPDRPQQRILPANPHSKVSVSSKDGEEGSRTLPLVLLKPTKEYKPMKIYNLFSSEPH